MLERDRIDARPEYLRPWQQDAACKGEDSSWFFAADAERKGARARREARARAVCRRCPVMEACRAHALRVQEPSGIRGALTEEERTQLLALPESAREGQWADVHQSVGFR